MADSRVLIENYFKITDTEYPTFRNVAKFGSGFIIIGGLLLYFENIGVFKDVILIGTIMILIGVASFFKWLRPFIFLKKIFYSRPSDEDMHVWFMNDIHEHVKARALDQLQINERSLKEENIIFIPYPVYWENSGAAPEHILRRSDSKGAFLYTVWTVQMLVVTEKYVSYYSCVYNWITNEMFNERTNEYFFDDIVSVRNDVENLSYNVLDDNGNVSEDASTLMAKTFKLVSMSGDSLTLITELPALGVPEEYVNSLEKLVKAMRVLLRNRRYGETIQLEDEGPIEVELPVEEDTVIENDTSPIAIFHQELHELFEDYSIAMDKKRKGISREN